MKKICGVLRLSKTFQCKDVEDGKKEKKKEKVEKKGKEKEKEKRKKGKRKVKKGGKVRNDNIKRRRNIIILLYLLITSLGKEIQLILLSFYFKIVIILLSPVA